MQTNSRPIILNIDFRLEYNYVVGRCQFKTVYCEWFLHARLRYASIQFQEEKKIPNDYDYLSYRWAYTICCASRVWYFYVRMNGTCLCSNNYAMKKWTQTYTLEIFTMSLNSQNGVRGKHEQQTCFSWLICFVQMQTVPVTLSSSLSEIVLCTCVDHFAMISIESINKCEMFFRSIFVFSFVPGFSNRMIQRMCVHEKF